MRKIKLLVPIVILAMCMMTACGDKAKKNVETEKATEKESSQGTETLLPLDNTDFYLGTWKGLFYYDPDNDKMKSMQEDGSSYYITFNENDLIISDTSKVMSAQCTTSDGIQKNQSGSDYFCIYYTDSNTQAKVTMALMMMNIKGEYSTGLKDGDYLAVMSSDNPNQYMFFEKVEQ